MMMPVLVLLVVAVMVMMVMVMMVIEACCMIRDKGLDII
jgi:hypothetical protein